jgi:hypothetical protein
MRITVRDGRKAKLATPGVYQVAGAPLKIGDIVVIRGPVPKANQPEVRVKASTDEFLVSARFPELGLEKGGTTIVSVVKRNGVPELIMRLPNGRRVRDKNAEVTRLTLRGLNRRLR